ncbi:MAG: PKD domain-containing protein [Bacteroidia bacterium]|nr:PKD domain-containing protein [Bacteroidia bacterium]
MKKLLAVLLIAYSFTSLSQNMVFFDDFDQGTGNWTLTGTWGLSTVAFTPPYSLTESPVGNYANNTDMFATMDTMVDLSNCMDATLEFSAKYSIEYGFDFMYVDLSPDAGQTWYNLTSFTGDSLTWYKYVFDISAFVGYTQFKARFRFESDALLNYDGMYIDDFIITTYSSDISAPFIVHYPKPHYEGLLYENPMEAQIFDISGVASTSLHYRVDGILQTPIPGINTTGNNYLFVIPQETPGAYVDYWFTATDASPAANIDTSSVYSYISGNYIKYDDGIVDYVNQLGYNSLSSQTGAAIRFTLGGLTNVVSTLIRNYTDSNSPNSQMLVHVWRNNGGVPGQDLITPIMVTPACNLAYPSKITRIDLRPYADSLSNLDGDVFIGFTVPTGFVWVCQSTPAVADRTFNYNQTSWTQIADDYMFRIVTSYIGGSPVADFSFNNVNDPMVQFTDLTSGNPTNWYWDFGDNGAISYLQNPSHLFSENGVFNVCLTSTNNYGATTNCHNVTITGDTPPLAVFSTDTTFQPEILFTDLSTHYPDTWQWNFGDNSPVTTTQNTMHTYSANGTYTVCLVVQNAEGSDTICQQVVIDDYSAPDASFSYNDGSAPLIYFYDESSSLATNSPTSWYWVYNDNGYTSTSQNPVYTFSTNGIFNVCLTASNNMGSSTFCNLVVIDNYIPPVAAFSANTSLSPTVAFIDMSPDTVISAPTSWFWNFDDNGATSLQSSPVHTFTHNGNFNVCMTVNNSVGSDSVCHQVIINNYALPSADFSWNSVNSPSIHFLDLSQGIPTYWSWDFGDGTGSELHNPFHTYAMNGSYEVCLIVDNYIGGDTVCHTVQENGYAAPQASYTFSISNDNIVQFTDQSVNSPTQWLWDFDDNSPESYDQNPIHTYATDGTYHACLTAYSPNGTSSPFCQAIVIIINTIKPIPTGNQVTVFPNPFSENTCICFEPCSGQVISSFSMFDVFGRRVTPKVKINQLSAELSRSGLSSGSYYYELKTVSGLVFRGKLCIQ